MKEFKSKSKVCLNYLMPVKERRQFVREMSSMNQQEHNGKGVVSFDPDTIHHLVSVTVTPRHEKEVIELINAHCEIAECFDRHVHLPFGKSNFRKYTELIAQFLHLKYDTVQKIIEQDKDTQKKIKALKHDL